MSLQEAVTRGAITQKSDNLEISHRAIGSSRLIPYLTHTEFAINQADNTH